MTAGTPRASRSSGSSPPPSRTPACCPPCWPSSRAPGSGCRCRSGAARSPTAPRSGCRWSATPRPTPTSCPASPRCSASPRGRTTPRRTRATAARSRSSGSPAAGGSGSGRATPGWCRTSWSPRPASPSGCRPASAWRSTPTARPASRCTRSRVSYLARARRSAGAAAIGVGHPPAEPVALLDRGAGPAAAAALRALRLPRVAVGPRPGRGPGHRGRPRRPGQRAALTGPSSARCWRPSRRCRCTSPSPSTSPSPANPPTTRRPRARGCQRRGCPDIITEWMSRNTRPFYARD